MSLSEARGKILHYPVTLQEVAGGKVTLQNVTEHTSWTWVVPRTGNWVVTVSAANSKGSSLPTRINVTDLLGPGKYQLSFNIAYGELCLISSLPQAQPRAWHELHRNLGFGARSLQRLFCTYPMSGLGQVN